MAFPSSSATLVPRALALVKQRFPEVKVTFTEAEPPESLAALRAGECDLAVAFAYEGTDLGRGEEDLDMFVTHKLMDDEVRLALPRSHPMAAAESASCPRCRRSRGSRAAPAARPPAAAVLQAGFPPNVSFETEDYVAVLGLVAEGLGVALIPDLILRSASHPDVVTLPIEPASRRPSTSSPPRTCSGAGGQGDPRRALRERPHPPRGSSPRPELGSKCW